MPAGSVPGSLLRSEIASQPDEITGFLDRQAERVWALAGKLPPFSYALVAARGSSDHAATYARYAWGALARLPVLPATPSLHTLYRTPPQLDHALVLGISQSGQSPDVVAVIEDARRQGRPTIAITNDGDSPLAQAADHIIELGLSTERSIAATKTYTGQLAAVALLGAAFSRDRARLDEVMRVPDAVARTLAAAAAPAALAAARLRGISGILCIARGMNDATAHELALKLRELLRLSTDAFSAADFRHGSIALVADGQPLLLIMPAGLAYEDMRTLAGEVRERGGDVTVISDQATAAVDAASFLPMAAGVPEWLTPLVAVLPGQLLAVELALARGLDPDRPRGLPEKVVRTL